MLGNLLFEAPPHQISGSEASRDSVTKQELGNERMRLTSLPGLRVTALRPSVSLRDPHSIHIVNDEVFDRYNTKIRIP